MEDTIQLQDKQKTKRITYLFLIQKTTHLSRPNVTGTKPGCLRAHSATLVDNKIFIFGGGDGPQYFSDLFVLDTLTMHWTKPVIAGRAPGPRRAHSACLYGKKIIIFGGGDGNKAINEIYILDSEKLAWESFKPKTDVQPQSRGYHSAVLHNGIMYVYGGSDGEQCFNDVFALDIEKGTWTKKKTSQQFPCFSHSASLVGSWMFVFGGHSAADHTDDLKVLNLDSRNDVLEWATKPITGLVPSARGYCSTTFYDNRIFLFGGYDSQQVFADTHILDLGIYSLFNTPNYIAYNKHK